MSQPPVVIVVDDDPGMSRAMARMIELGGMTPLLFPSAEAMLADRCDGAACIVIDVQLPGMDGLELHEMLVARGDRTPVLFVSASEEAEARAHDATGSPAAFLAKPFSGLALLERLKTLLDKVA